MWNDVPFHTVTNWSDARVNSIDYSTALSDLHELGSRPDAESGGLDRLVVACHVARDAYQELEWEADHVASGPVKELLRIASGQAWEVWQRMERAGLPLLQEWQRDNGLLAPASDKDEDEDEATPRPARCHACGWQGGAVSSDCPHCGAVSLTGITAYDGEQIGSLVYNANIAAWVYSAAYDDMDLCQRRADSLTRSLGAQFNVAYRGDGWVAVTDTANTPQLRAAMATQTPAAADAEVEC